MHLAKAPKAPKSAFLAYKFPIYQYNRAMDKERINRLIYKRQFASKLIRMPFQIISSLPCRVLFDNRTDPCERQTVVIRRALQR